MAKKEATEAKAPEKSDVEKRLDRLEFVIGKYHGAELAEYDLPIAKAAAEKAEADKKAAAESGD